MESVPDLNLFLLIFVGLDGHWGQKWIPEEDDLRNLRDGLRWVAGAWAQYLYSFWISEVHTGTESATVISTKSTNSGPDQNHWKPFLRVTTYMVNEPSDQFPSGAPQNPHIRLLWYSEGTWMWVWRSPVWISGTGLRTNFPEKPFQGHVHGGSPPATNPSLDLRGWGLPVNVWVGSKGSYFLEWGSCRFRNNLFPEIIYFLE